MLEQLKVQLQQKINSLASQVKLIISQVNELRQAIVMLKSNSEKLQNLMPELKTLQTDVERSVAKFEFKTQPRLERIQQHVDHIQTELNKFQRKSK